MVDLLIAISPPKDVSEKVMSLRKLLFKKTKTNPFKDTEAHITFFVNTFHNISDVDKELKKITKKYKSFTAEIERITAFKKDPIWKSTTIIYKIKKNKELNQIQQEIFKKLAPLRTDKQLKWLLAQNNKFSKEIKKNLKKYGYAFSPKNWVFHISIASVPVNKYKALNKYIKKYNLNKKWKVQYITLFKYYKDKGFKTYKKYKLKD